MGRRRRSMWRHRDGRLKPPAYLALGIAAVGILGGAIGVTLANMPDRSPGSAVAYTPKPMPERPTPLQQIDLPDPGSRVVFIGDSWTGGYAAEPSTNGFMWLTGDRHGWDYEVFYMSGSGYLNNGQFDEGTYLDRLAEAPDAPDAEMVFVQGSVNDGGESLGKLAAAAKAVIDELQVRYPAATIVMVGPPPLSFPVGDRTRTMNSTLWSIAALEGAAYISMLTEDWLTAENIGQYIDPEKANHPTTTGHAYLAERLSESLEVLATAPR